MASPLRHCWQVLNNDITKIPIAADADPMGDIASDIEDAVNSVDLPRHFKGGRGGTKDIPVKVKGDGSNASARELRVNPQDQHAALRLIVDQLLESL